VRLRDKIAAAQASPDRKPLAVEVPEWDTTVYLRKLTVEDQIEMSEGVEAKDMPVQVLLHCLVDENGEPELTAEDAALLAKEEFPTILRLFTEAAKLNGLTTKELDEAMASFDGTRPSSGSSDWPSPSANGSTSSQTYPVPS
jgi:hypothetical protein